jgi:hypothetical protein
VATDDFGPEVNTGPTLGFGVGGAVGGGAAVEPVVGGGTCVVAVGVGAVVGLAVALTVVVALGPALAVAGTDMALGLGAPVAAATSPQPATGKELPSAKSSRLLAGTQPSFATGPGT